MKFFRMICRMLCLAAALLVFTAACGAGEALTVEDAGLDFSEALSIHYPVVAGPGDEDLLKQVNGLIQERCRIGDYLGRAARLLSGGSLKTEWKGGITGEVFSCAVSALGAVENTRVTHVWTAASADLRDGHEITFAELFTDEETARELITAYLEENVSPDLSAHLLNSELTPLPETFYLEPSGLTFLYPVSRLSTLSDRAGEIRIGWHVLRDALDPDEDGIPARIGAEDMITLSGQSMEKIRKAGEEGRLDGIPAKIGDSVQELTDRYHTLTDPDGFEGGRLFALEGGAFRGVYLMTDDLTRSWENSRVQGIRMDQGCLWGLCVGETPRAEWLAELGEADGSAEIGEEKAEANRIVPGTCDYYRCGDYLLQLYSDVDGTLVSIMLTE